jgi:large subunit ribosomal protein L9
MQIILLDKVTNLGALGDVVKVKDGYARNFLIPTGRARRATSNAIAEFEARRAELEKVAAAKHAEAAALGEKLSAVTVKLSQKAGVDGRLFGSVTNHDVSEELNKLGFAVNKSQVRMPNGPLKLVGDYTVSVHLHTDVTVDVNVSVLGEADRSPGAGAQALHPKAAAPSGRRLFSWFGVHGGSRRALRAFGVYSAVVIP